MEADSASNGSSTVESVQVTRTRTTTALLGAMSMHIVNRLTSSAGKAGRRPVFMLHYDLRHRCGYCELPVPHRCQPAKLPTSKQVKATRLETSLPLAAFSRRSESPAPAPWSPPPRVARARRVSPRTTLAGGPLLHARFEAKRAV